MRATVLVVMLVTTVLVGGCLDRGTGQDGGAEQTGPGGSPTTTPMAVPSPPVEDPTRPIDGYEAHPACQDDAAECFTFVWVKGEEHPTVLEGPEGVPYRGQGPFCDDRNPLGERFAHEVRLEDKQIIHPSGQEVAPQEVLLALDHFRPAKDCAVAFALLPDPVGHVPIDMGRAGTHTFAWTAPELIVNVSHPVPPGQFLAIEYSVTETSGEWVVRHDGRFEVRNLGLWPSSSLVPYDEAAT